jgi:DNA-binding transcriptional LysR family regulator
MNLKRLETFYWVTRLGSFSAAAARLNTTQPAVSTRIRQLERSLGVTLFEGNTRNMRLTFHGRKLVPQAGEIVVRMADIYGSLGASKELTGTVRIGAIDTVALTWLPRLVAMVGIRYPGIKVELLVALSVDLRERLHRGNLDIAFLVGPVSSETMVTWPVGRVAMSWMASPDLELSMTPATPANLAEAVVISHTQGSDLHTRTRDWFRRAGVEPPRFHECSSLATMIRLTMGVVGVAVLPAATLEWEIQEGILRLLPAGPRVPDSEIIAAGPRERPFPMATEIVQMGVELAAADSAFQPQRSAG